MSQLSDLIASTQASFTAAEARVNADVASLKAQLAAAVAAGPTSQADLDAIAALKVQIDALDPTSPVTLPPPPTVP